MKDIHPIGCAMSSFSCSDLLTIGFEENISFCAGMVIVRLKSGLLACLFCHIESHLFSSIVNDGMLSVHDLSF